MTRPSRFLWELFLCPHVRFLALPSPPASSQHLWILTLAPSLFSILSLDLGDHRFSNTTWLCQYRFAIMIGMFLTSLPFGNFNLLNLNECETSCTLDVLQCWESELVLGGETNLILDSLNLKCQLDTKLEDPRSI